MASDDDADAVWWRQVDDWLDEEAEARGAVHGDRRRGIVPNRDFIGLRGEVEFGRVFRQPLDLRRLREGDKGIDFKIPLRFTVDVKATGNPDLGLLVPVNAPYWADIYVLAFVDLAEGKVELLGWQVAAEIRRQPIIELSGGPNYQCKKLRPMSELAERVMFLR